MRYAVYILSSVLVTALVAAFLAAATGLAYIREQAEKVPDLEPLLDYRPAVHSSVYDASGQEVFAFGTERREPTGIDDIPKVVIDAFIAAEDQNFWEHPGFDVRAIMRAALGNAVSGEVQSGASTITQQLVKNVVLTNEQSIERKAVEALAAAELENLLPKEALLERYLNEIYLGRGAYGVAVAAETYFDKALEDLSAGEAAFLAGLPKAPSRFGRSSSAAKERQAYVLGRMKSEGYLTEDDYAAALEAPLVLDGERETFLKQSHYLQAALPEIKSLMGSDMSLTEGGLEIHLAQDPEIQEIAERALQDGLMAYDRRQGEWRGHVTLDHEPALDHWRVGLLIRKDGEYSVSFGLESAPLSKASVDWADRSDSSLSPGSAVVVEIEDGVAELRQEPDVQGAVVAMDPRTGRVLGLSGAFREGDAFFNRATMARRQPGSALKPFIYAKALQSGWAPNSPILDGGLALDPGAGQAVWRPRDHGYSDSGYVTLRTGLVKSRNTVTLRLFDALGAETVAETLETLGVYDAPPAHGSLALGAEEAALLDVVSGYAALASDGRPVTPTFLNEVRGIEAPEADTGVPSASNMDSDPFDVPVFDPITLTQVRSMLRGVVERGTAWRAFETADYELQGKTGTSNGSKDTWFIGFTRNLLVGAYVGFDDPSPLGRYEAGGRTAAPIVRGVFDNVAEPYRGNDYPFPAGAELRKIDRDSGVPGAGDFPEILRQQSHFT
ncbi:penicillin-binding protein 1A [Salipiger mucosus]|uniref:peptidoglycan glycosyltransferase n=1 Tax=Salipiger mucosus DSM 16094 TaxID=1123237 RepID=S9SD26_9RHOB|nr:transglycosylase domain-containing protein [Salipiger mucosus]EPX84114.1 Multimodular transpeptidase-transglycosylase [Salipiger mucosus DSM 16094]